MGRAQIYYAANELSEVQIAGPGEFIDSITLEPYEGPYVEANGQYIAGSNPRLGDPILKRVADLAGEKFRQPISSEYYRLTRREYDNHYSPVSVTRQPTEEEREDGSMIRYFAQKKNETSKIYEIDEEQYIAFNRENNVGIDSRMYHKIEMRWFISGKDAIQNNTINIELLNSRYPGMQSFFATPTQFVQFQSPKNKTYPDGVMISDKLPDAYGESPNSNQACLNCHFRHNNYCSKWVAQIRRQYWCASWKQHDIEQKNSY
jgi:hypothetical protein|tara:strand:- start:99 stop:881 length:783 start_codon:yes stop_codon:yes gene_type:complete